jgi:adenine-specific DNA-methyltransferase
MANQEFQWGPGNPHPLSTMRTELVWEGKYDEYGRRREVDVAGAALPMQRIETVDEPRQRAEAEGQLALFEKKRAGQKQDDFRNRLIWGDNKLVMASLLKEFKGKIDLIYIDPPFDVGADFTMDVPLGDGFETTEKDQSALEMVAYRDTWGRGNESFVTMIYERLALAHTLLAETGSIYVHCDPRVNSFIRLILNEVFGENNFQNEIAWKRQSAHSDAKRYGPIHDTIFFYTKTENFVWSPQYEPLGEDYIEAFFTNVDDHGRRFSRGDLTAPGPRPNLEYEWRGYKPGPGRCWAVPMEKLEEYYRDDRIFFPKKGIPRLKRYPEDSPGVLLQDVWTNVKIIHNQSLERVGYPTQKPEALLERIIRASTSDNGGGTPRCGLLLREWDDGGGGGEAGAAVDYGGPGAVRDSYQPQAADRTATQAA